ncbi:uncharacterized protein [Macrobrachium rosenbergii]|uniref:uncharacterized protein n=1 Tax=Macrobrachium rosenbergii TaxID=79674 RepID=UPI0034D40D9B
MQRPSNNYSNAAVQLSALEKQFQKDPGYRESYQRVLVTYLSSGFIEEVSETQNDGYFMPHFSMRKECSTTPLRIVFNASSKRKGELSLNDCLYAGPNLVELYNLLLRFRTNPYAVISDVSKAFLRVLLHSADCKYVQFLWRQKPSKTATYAFRVVVFGVTTSLYLLQQVLHTHLRDNGRGELMKSFYVDNFLKTYDSVPEMKAECKHVKALLADTGMPLTG